MRLASISSLLDAARRIFLRFPGTLVSAMLAAKVAIGLVDKQPAPERSMNLLMAAALGIPLFTALRLFWEKSPRGRPLSRSWIPLVGGALLLLLYWHLLNRDPGDSRYYRYCEISLALHLAVAIAPFLGRGEINGFWQFNRRLFLRAFLSAIYAAVFFGGLALALAAVDHLFDVKLDNEIYPRLWLFTVFVFQTWHFLGGVPLDLAGLERDRQHPNALKIFSQYMLVPLVVLYVFILYAYMGKILMSPQWPQGWVGWLVSYAAIFGVLTLLLLHPGRQDTESRWIKVFERAFYAAVLPLLGLLFVALGKRAGQYGVTERRYFLFVLGLWLGGIALYMLFSTAKNIKIVPVTLGVTALLTACGPWGAYQASLRSQSRRLESLLTRYGRLADGKITTSTTPVDRTDLKEISAAVEYIVTNHGAKRLNRWRGPQWGGVGSERPTWDQRYRATREFLAAMGLEYVSPWGGSTSFAYYQVEEDGLDVVGFEWLVPFHFGSPTAGKDSGKYSARLGDRGRTVEILRGSTVILKESLEPMLKRLPSPHGSVGNAVPSADMCLVAADPSLRDKVCFTNLTMEREGNDTASVQYGSGYLLIDTTP
ncbi:MAG TPA: DUF4153 domain-containing protein [Candidatus Polarisedimenticolia bacterium]|nr:DUF4153 domain-containing protein [Candidatus Polarisedimenticolia bacterium]